MSNKKLAVLVAGKMVQDQEFIYPYYRLQEAGYDVDVAVENKEIVYASMGLRIVPTIDIYEIELLPYQIMIIPGGAKGMEYMRQDQKLLKAVSQFYKGGGVIASICHGAQILISAKLVEKRHISGYYSIKDDINNAGGIYVESPVVTSDRIVSSPHYKYMGAWMKEALRVSDALSTRPAHAAASN